MLVFARKLVAKFCYREAALCGALCEKLPAREGLGSAGAKQITHKVMRSDARATKNQTGSMNDGEAHFNRGLPLLRIIKHAEGLLR